jgi:hypothetical protein
MAKLMLVASLLLAVLPARAERGSGTRVTQSSPRGTEGGQPMNCSEQCSRDRATCQKSSAECDRWLGTCQSNCK